MPLNVPFLEYMSEFFTAQVAALNATSLDWSKATGFYIDHTAKNQALMLDARLYSTVSDVELVLAGQVKCEQKSAKSTDSYKCVEFGGLSFYLHGAKLDRLGGPMFVPAWHCNIVEKNIGTFKGMSKGT